MNRNNFQIGGWQPKAEPRFAFKFLYLLIPIGFAALVILAILLSRYFLVAQLDVAAFDISTANPRQLITAAANASIWAEPQTATLAPVPTPTAENDIQEDADYLLLVNAQHPLPADYQPDDLVPLDSAVHCDIIKLKEAHMFGVKAAVQALDNMLSDATEKGYSNWQIGDAYRSIAVQQEIWDKTYQKYLNENGLSPAKALQATKRRVAEPGCSEHHTGLAFDLSIPGEAFRLTEQCAWIAENCWKYGFIVRYSEDKERITGISAEPWHIRFVGEKVAAEIYQSHLALEEYLD